MVPAGAVVYLLAAAAVLNVARGVVWTVGNSNVSLTHALEMLESHSVIYLESGEHRIERFRLLQDLTNVSIIGLGTDAHDVSVSCGESVGLAFVNVSELTLQNLHLERCGMSRGNLQQALEKLQEILVIFHHVQNDTSIGLFFGHCTDVMMQSVAVTNTVGLGMLGVNMMGTSSMSSVDFIGNIRRLDDGSFKFPNETYSEDSMQANRRWSFHCLL